MRHVYAQLQLNLGDVVIPSPTLRRPRRIVTAAVTAATFVAAVGVGSVGAHAAVAPTTAPVATANGTFLSGSVLGIDLDKIAKIHNAQAAAAPASQLQVDPLTVTLLSAITLPLGATGLNLLGPNSLINLGAANQYAEANADGTARAATGTANNNGGVTVGGTPGYPADAKIDLTRLIQDKSILTEALITTGAVTATATKPANGAITHGYQIAGMTLDLNSPLLGNLLMSVKALQPIVDAVNGLGVITGLPNLGDFISTVGKINVLGGGINTDLATGQVRIDVNKLLKAVGLDLSNLPPNTELLPIITKAIGDSLLPAIQQALNTLLGQLSVAIQNIKVAGIPIGQALPKALTDLVNGILTPLQKIVNGLATQVLTPLAQQLTNLVSLQANVQQSTPDLFTERALQLTVLPKLTSPLGAQNIRNLAPIAANGPLAQINLATAAVGPNNGNGNGGNGGGGNGGGGNGNGGNGQNAPTAQSLNPDHGPTTGGQLVTINGTNFTPGSTVTIGGKSVTPEFVAPDGKTLTFVTPPHPAGPVNVTVTTAGGTTAPLTYTYVPSTVPAPVITNPTDGSTVNTPNPPIEGTGTPGGKVTVNEGGKPVCTATVKPDGTWACVPTKPLNDGKHTIAAQQTVGKDTSAQSNKVTFTVATGSGIAGVSSGGNKPAVTGADVFGALALALLAIAGGAAALFVGRRRRGETA